LTSDSTIKSIGKVEKWARGVFAPEEGVDIGGVVVAIIDLLKLELLIIQL
jgi:hypothetical protein